MRYLLTILLLSCATLSAWFIYGYARVCCLLAEPPGSIVDTLGLPHVYAYRPFVPGFHVHAGFALFSAGDVPEGAIPLFYWPSWPFAIVAVGAVISSAILLFRVWSRHHIVEHETVA